MALDTGKQSAARDMISRGLSSEDPAVRADAYNILIDGLNNVHPELGEKLRDPLFEKVLEGPLDLGAETVAEPDVVKDAASILDANGIPLGSFDTRPDGTPYGPMPTEEMQKQIDKTAELDALEAKVPQAFPEATVSLPKQEVKPVPKEATEEEKYAAYLPELPGVQEAREEALRVSERHDVASDMIKDIMIAQEPDVVNPVAFKRDATTALQDPIDGPAIEVALEEVASWETELKNPKLTLAEKKKLRKQIATNKADIVEEVSRIAAGKGKPEAVAVTAPVEQKTPKSTVAPKILKEKLPKV